MAEAQEMRDDGVLVSVVVATRDDGWHITGLLDAVATQDLGAAAGRLEVVAVDNSRRRRSSRSLCAALLGGAWLFPVRCVREPVAGLSRARNAGLRAAAGRYVVFVDPDTRPASGWLSALVAAAEDEAAVVVGGRVDSEYPQGTAVPLTESLAQCHGPTDWPTRRRAYAWPYWVSGCNLLVDRAAALRLGLLRTDLGRRGRWLLGCEDLEFVDRAAQQGLRVVIEPNARVRHPVTRRATTARWFVAQGVGHGISVARMHRTVRVEPAAIRAGWSALRIAVEGLLVGWGFLDRAAAVDGIRDLARISAYHLERGRIAVLSHASASRKSARRGCGTGKGSS